MAGTENRHLAAGSGGAGAASDQPHARHWTNLALATGQCKAQAKTGRFLPRPGAILTPMRQPPTAAITMLCNIGSIDAQSDPPGMTLMAAMADFPSVTQSRFPHPAWNCRSAGAPLAFSR